MIWTLFRREPSLLKKFAQLSKSWPHRPPRLGGLRNWGLKHDIESEPHTLNKKEIVNITWLCLTHRASEGVRSICKDKSHEYGLGLSIPTVDDFRKIVRRGVRISPMKYFFEAVGFSSKDADRVFAQYKETFMRDYSPKLFPQIGDMLLKLTSA